MNRVRQFCIFSFLLFTQLLAAQNLFLNECYDGGVVVVGKGGLGPLTGEIQTPWNDQREIRRAYALTYRYDRPEPKTFTLDETESTWDYSSQVGIEFADGPFISYFAVHAQEVTESLEPSDNSITIDMDGVDVSSPDHLNQGWWSIMIVILYESEFTQEQTCINVYTASQPQIAPQEYEVFTPAYDLSKDFGFSIYAERIGQTPNDNSILGINSLLLGEIGLGVLGGNEIGSMQGHFQYQDGVLLGLSDDTADSVVDGTDGLALINDYLTSETTQTFYFSAIDYPPSTGAANPHPAFFLTYTPDCAVLPDLGDVPREYDFCRGDTVQLSTTSAYDTFRWSEAAGLSDSTVADPLCFADSSGWYTVKMWNEGEEGCSQTIPVFIEVNEIPEPQELNIRASSCPDNTGQIRAIGPAGKSPFSYWLEGLNQGGNVSDGLAPGLYDYRIRSAAGCEWDTTVALPLDPFQEASFDAFPASGYSPLDVFFTNTSTQATGYQWLIDGVPVSESEDITYTFPDSGSFEVSLIAYRLEESCADTASFTLRVEPGIRVLMPNIITPNGDGRNDALVAQVQGIASCRWVIYNRWGNEVAAGEEGDVFQTVELWQPEGEVTAGQYTVAFVAEGLAGQVEKMVFEVAVVR